MHSHAPFLSSLKIGEVKILDEAGKESRYASSGGFVEVHDNKVVMLAETAERSDQIEVERAEAAKKRAQGRLSGKRDAIDFERARAALFRAVNRLKIAGRA